MATPNTTSEGDGHFSFAKIAAMPATLESQSSPAYNNTSNDSQPTLDSAGLDNHHAGVPLPQPHLPHTLKQASSVSDPCVDGLGRAVQDIDITLQKDHLRSGSSLDGHENGLLKRENSFDDDRTHLSNSSTKMTNFDSKSLASVTTFAMDEKDSVRPDDSASVQAIDDEESLSGPASGAPNSLTGSEAGGRGFRDQFRDGSALRPRGILPVPGPIFNGGNQRGAVAIPPDSVSNNFIVANPGSIPDGSSLHGLPKEPDEKLLEAMKSSKDRLLILQLEEKIRNFIKNSDEQSLELPPSNAFGRLLAHKLGDYYHLTHFVDNNVTSVRLHRTPFCRTPTPVSEIYAANNTTPPPAVPAMKIMRRNDGERPSADGSVAASSSVPSKATSETGDSGIDGERGGSSGAPSQNPLGLSREEREAKYQEVRERIFRDFSENSKSDTSESNPNMSRSSSTTGRKKNHRQRTPNDDGFEARSQFNAYYPGNQYSNGSVPYNGTMSDGYPPNPVPYLVGPGVNPPPNGYVAAGQNNAMHPGQMNMNNMPQYPIGASPQMGSNGTWQGGNMPQQPQYPGYPSMSPSGLMSQQSSNKPSPTMNNYAMPQSQNYSQSPNWNSSPYSGSFQQSPLQRNQPPVHWPNYPQQQQQSMTPNMAANPYAQFPGQHLNNGMHNQAGRPVMPAGYERSHFNPQTRAFIPGGAPLSRHASRGAQPMPYGNMQPTLQTQPQWAGYTEPIQARGQEHSPVNSTRTASVSSRDSIAKWGTPSHLPPKPPPSEVPSEFDLTGRTGPSSYQSNGIPSTRNGPLVVSGGAGGPKSN